MEVVWSTGARARNFVPPLGPILEELDMAPSAVRMAGLCSGRAPVLDSHRRGGVLAFRLALLAAERGISLIEVQDGKVMLTRQGDFVMVGNKFPRLARTEPPARLKEIRKLLLALY